jgi:hypothetical protein
MLGNYTWGNEMRLHYVNPFKQVPKSYIEHAYLKNCLNTVSVGKVILDLLQYHYYIWKGQ